MSKSSKPAAVSREQEWLNGAERVRLAALEETIERGARVFIATGKALTEIRDSRLYRATHETFEAYVTDRFDGLTRRRAYQLIDAAHVAGVCTAVHIPEPTSERQARELAEISEDADKLRTVWTGAVERFGPKPTASQIRSEVRRAVGPQPLRAVPDLPDVPKGDSSDLRFESIDHAVAILKLMPAPEQINWPVDEPGDIETIDAAMAWLDEWLPNARASWRQHKRALRQMGAAAS